MASKKVLAGSKLNSKKKCPQCSKILSCGPALWSHSKIHVVNRPKFKCSVAKCVKEYYSKDNLNMHIQKIHLGTFQKFKCSFDGCDNAYNNQTSLKHHVQKIHLGTFKKFGCSFCNSKFMSRGSLNGHIVSVHTAEKAFPCQVCPSKFSTLGLLRNHRVVHMDEMPYDCSLCDKKFKRKYALKKHTTAHTTGRSRNFKCTICQKAFFGNGGLKRHTLIHTHTQDGGNFACYFCKKRFMQRTALGVHIRSHTQEKPFICSVGSCQFSCSSSSNLIAHRKRHLPARERPQSVTWTCYFCSKMIGSYSAFGNHLRLHTLEEPFICGLCRRGFKTEGILKRHISSHTMEKPFKCEECLKAFAYRGDLKTHTEAIHKRVKRHFCEHCNYSAYHKNDVDRHSGQHARA